MSIINPQNPNRGKQITLADRIFEGLPKNHLLFDVATEHRKIIHGAFMNAIREITGKPPDQEDLVKNAGIESMEHMGWVDYVYKKRTILRVFVPVITRIDKNHTKVYQRVDEVWKRKGKGRN